MSVVSFKVKKRIKEKMERYRDKINWPEELRRFVEQKIREIEAGENIEKVVQELRTIDISVPKGFSVKSVREDRDSH